MIKGRFGVLLLALLVFFPVSVFAQFFGTCDTANQNASSPDLELSLFSVKTGVVVKGSPFEVLYIVTNCGPGATNYDLEIILSTVDTGSNFEPRRNIIAGRTLTPGESDFLAPNTVKPKTTTLNATPLNTTDLDVGNYRIQGIARRLDGSDPNTGNNIQAAEVKVELSSPQIPNQPSPTSPPPGGNPLPRVFGAHLEILSTTEIKASWPALTNPVFQDCNTSILNDGQGREVIRDEICDRLAVIGYNLKWRKVNQDWDASRNIETQALIHTVSNLEPGTDYFFSIQGLFMLQRRTCTTQTTYPPGFPPQKFTSCSGWNDIGVRTYGNWSEVSSARTYPDPRFGNNLNWLPAILHLLLN